MRRRRRLQALPAQAGVVLGMVALLIAWYGVVDVPPAAARALRPDGSEPGTLRNSASSLRSCASCLRARRRRPRPAGAGVPLARDARPGQLHHAAGLGRDDADRVGRPRRGPVEGDPAGDLGDAVHVPRPRDRLRRVLRGGARGDLRGAEPQGRRGRRDVDGGGRLGPSSPSVVGVFIAERRRAGDDHRLGGVQRALRDRVLRSSRPTSTCTGTRSRATRRTTASRSSSSSPSSTTSASTGGRRSCCCCSTLCARLGGSTHDRGRSKPLAPSPLTTRPSPLAPGT